MALKKILAATLAAVLALSLAACGSKDEAETTTEAPVTIADTTVADTTAAEETSAEAETTDAAEEKTEAETTASAEEETQAPAEETTEEAKKVPETKQEIVDFYKAAAAETDKGAVNTDFVMDLQNLEGDGGFGKIAGAFENVVRNTLAKKSTPGDSITGGYTKLSADDVASATAKDDGKYTTVTINLKDQTDGFTGDAKEGHVGHGISVLGNVQSAIDALNGVDVDTDGGSVALHYNNASITAKIDNETGKIVSGTWKYTVNIDVKDVKLKLGPIPVNVPGLRGAINATTKL